MGGDRGIGEGEWVWGGDVFGRVLGGGRVWEGEGEEGEGGVARLRLESAGFVLPFWG